VNKFLWILTGIVLGSLAGPSLCRANLNEDLLDAVIGNDNQKASELILGGADVNVRQPDGWTPLLFAVFDKNFTLARILIEKGADINAQDSRAGISVLMRAVDRGDVEFIKYLIEKRVNVNARQRAGNTALSYARSGRRGDIIQILQAAGAQ